MAQSIVDREQNGSNGQWQSVVSDMGIVREYGCRCIIGSRH